ncbi:AfsR/SARP family transcriptional regulator [Streptomyces sp. TRM76323]|uniref:AfsR/SARP family transcriptional regulator n=1 Tax=Streptomyces tamarix TaxID=3078565 RepID=A0ABU3QRS3_9ACTN|nr:AfsR/SARP family transcriptional regulator [Streptomyces tamarix]MDT9685437.1 AfsR/SARP family transcriptional regulator [Streptomyces tamarix]
MENEETDGRTLTVAPGAGGGRRMQIVLGQWSGGGAGDARRIAELEREVCELRRANATLKMYAAKALGLDVKFPLPDAGFETAGDRHSAHVATTSRRTPPGRAGWAEAPAPEAPKAPDAPPTGIEFRVLGPLEAAVAGRRVDLGAPKQRAALALLVSQVGQPVSVDVMLEELWGGQPPRSAITSLHAYIANLRRALEPDRAPRKPATVLRTRGRGYLLDSRVVEVDAHHFGEHATAGWQALDRRDPQRALREFEAGLALWRGRAYEEVADATRVAPEVVRLEELRLSVIEGRCASLLAVGAYEVAVSELAAFTQAHPLREYGCELLSLALYRAGRQADALAVLRTHQKRMAEELGIDPSPALQHLESEILRQAPVLD